MKKNYFLLSVAAFAFFFANKGVAQMYNYDGQTYSVSKNTNPELRAGTEKSRSLTFVENIDKGELIAYHCSNCGDNRCTIEQTIPLADVFKKAFSKEKIKNLASDKG
jgi:hypothetical protein